MRSRTPAPQCRALKTAGLDSGSNDGERVASAIRQPVRPACAETRGERGNPRFSIMTARGRSDQAEHSASRTIRKRIDGPLRRPYRRFSRFRIAVVQTIAELMAQKPQPLNQVASVEEIRAHFPALERNHEGYPVAYFDGPGG